MDDGLAGELIPEDLIDSADATARHEAGHALLHRLLRGTFHAHASLRANAFDPGPAPRTCHHGDGFLGGVCAEEYCAHEVWEDLAGPAAEWIYRREVNATTRGLLPWMHALSNASLARVGPNRVNGDDLTSALHNYCDQCLILSNTPSLSDSVHSNEHAIRAVEREAEIVEALVRERWSWVERLAAAFLANSDGALSGSTLTSLLADVTDVDADLLLNSRGLREQDNAVDLRLDE